jgi:CDP-glycerol glycerophosphotransferase (TagB/SpsB family)
MFLITQPIDVNSLIYYADVVLGFFSNFLVEATILNKPVLRFFLNKEMIDPFEKMNIGKVVYPENIISELQQIN